MLKRLNHVSIAVSDLDKAAAFYVNQLGLELTGTEVVPSNKVTVGFLPIGGTTLELVQPDSPDSPISKFLDKHGPGLHHICFEVSDIVSELKRLDAAGVRLIDKTPRPGAHGTLVGFIHPQATGGVLIELCQPKA